MSIMQDKAAVTVTQDINSRIASRVRTLRTDRGMTLDGIAAKCDVSLSMISVVERGESSLTAVVFEKIAAGACLAPVSHLCFYVTPSHPANRRGDRPATRAAT